MNKCLITGGKGFIGSRLGEYLRSKGVEVYSIDLKDQVDCAFMPSLTQYPDPDVIFHLAAHPVYINHNTLDALHTVVHFAGLKKIPVVYASSAAVHEPLKSIYGAQKLYGESYIANLLPKYTILRLFNVYGGGHGIADKIKRKEHIQVNGNGEQTRDFVHVNDVVRAFAIAGMERVNGAFEIGTGKSTSVNQLLTIAGHEDYEYVNNPWGITHSQANPDMRFPWRAEYKLEDFYEEA